MGRDAHCVNALLVNGKGSVSCLEQETIEQFTSAAQKGVLGYQSLTDIGYGSVQRVLACINRMVMADDSIDVSRQRTWCHKKITHTISAPFLCQCLLAVSRAMG
jgi:hypothetical protein